MNDRFIEFAIIYAYCISVLYGDTSKDTPPDGTNWDTIADKPAQISFPEHLVQTQIHDDYFIYFLDIKSCARRINRTSGEIKTFLGERIT